MARTLLAAVAAIFFVAGFATAQDKSRTVPKRGSASSSPALPPGEVYDIECPNCKHNFSHAEAAEITCPNCGRVHKATKKGDSLSLTSTETSENKWKKPLLIGGGVLLVLGLIGMILKKTVLAAPPPKKKKKKRRDEEDDRPRKKKPRVLDDDEEDDRPRKKKPRLVDED
jgi:ribosomal protein S27E